ncbi:hypothetical protein MGAST_13310 [Mycobacterium gastri 'Wayne']|uniref:Uncharacterized protein n=1 Tax=Mycobacterium gastri TaxID=1777 RepID=A0A1X1VCA8_MYCGS|nr:hypothetical protein MGAST_13310 [Mycobacterium gastri 'Wayne']ORV66684.1 hypothetical protein AWC07_11000 [Mycobacterium gastri]
MLQWLQHDCPCCASVDAVFAAVAVAGLLALGFHPLMFVLANLDIDPAPPPKAAERLLTAR